MTGTDGFGGETRAQAHEASRDEGHGGCGPTMGEVVAARFGRRGLFRGALAAAAISATLSPLAPRAARAGTTQTGDVRADVAGAGETRFDFAEVPAGVDHTHHVPEGYEAQVLIRWGDPVLPGAPAFDPHRQSADAQAGQFGYNNDYVGYIPMPGAANPSAHGLLVVNHEYTSEELMFPGMTKQETKQASFGRMTRELVEIEMMAHGGSVLEVRRGDGGWRVVDGSRFARRITAETPCRISGPAAGDARMRTGYDPQGRTVRGMLNNCAGGLTPWGTWLTCEENFNGYFGGAYAEGHPEAASGGRYGVPGLSYDWARHHDRFDVAKEPNEPNRFGWVVEIDPFDPASVPVKRTALGRYKHEGAANLVNPADGRFVVYMGDDERFDHVYKFVTADPVDPRDKSANRDILDRGTLYVARYDADGTGEWLPLVHGHGPLTAANGLRGQADVLIEARRAGDLLGATRMDRPEGTEVDARTGKVFVALTNNTRREANEVDAANPRPDNAFGHIVEMAPEGGDHAATRFRWEILVKCGDPAVAAVGATFSSATTRDGWFGMPDMLALDSQGRLWVGTDGQSDASVGHADGLYAVETQGSGRGTSKLFFRCPVGAELCGPELTPDDGTFFVAVQHPGEDGEQWRAFGRPSTFDDPATRWPDFRPDTPPRPAVLAITRAGGGKIA